MRGLTKRQTVIMLCVLGAVGVGLLAYWQLQPPTQHVIIPQTVSNQLLFTPYVPTALPQGYVVKSSSFEVKEGALLFTATDASGHLLTISEQAVPKNFNIDDFYQQSVIHPQRIDGLTYPTIFGKLAAQNGSLVSITTSDNTWIIITSPTNLAQSDAKFLTQHMTAQR